MPLLAVDTRHCIKSGVYKSSIVQFSTDFKLLCSNFRARERTHNSSTVRLSSATVLKIYRIYISFRGNLYTCRKGESVENVFVLIGYSSKRDNIGPCAAMSFLSKFTRLSKEKPQKLNPRQKIFKKIY